MAAVLYTQDMAEVSVFDDPLADLSLRETSSDDASKPPSLGTSDDGTRDSFIRVNGEVSLRLPSGMGVPVMTEEDSPS